MKEFAYLTYEEIFHDRSVLERSLLLFENLVIDDWRSIQRFHKEFYYFLTYGVNQSDIPDEEKIRAWNDFSSASEYRPNFNWLYEEGLIGRLWAYPEKDSKKLGAIEVNWKDSPPETFQVSNSSNISDRPLKIGMGEDISPTILAHHVRKKNHALYPIFVNEIKPLESIFKKKEKVLSVLLRNIPAPAPNTPFEQIKDFILDPDSKEKMVRLKDWVNDYTRMDLTALELQQKLEYLVQEYRAHMEIHKMKHQASAFETVIKGTAETMEAFVKGEFSKVVSPLFAARHQQIAMIEAERNTKDNRIAYIVKVHNVFGK